MAVQFCRQSSKTEKSNKNLMSGKIIVAVKADPKPRSDEGSVYSKTVRRLGANGRMRDETIYFARQRYTDKEGKNREKKRTCATHALALKKLRELQDEIEEELNPKPKITEAINYGFSDFADIFEHEYIKKAVIVKGKKISGYKSDLKTLKYYVRLFKDFFKNKPLSEITSEDLINYKIERMQTPVKKIVKVKIPVTEEDRKRLNLNIRQKFLRVKKETVKEREFATTNREMVVLRRMFKIAVIKKFIKINPFSETEKIIDSKLETTRMRIASFEEEKNLLDSCVGKRAHLRSIIIFAIDTAMREDEIFSIKWKNLDFETRRILVPLEITKNEKYREVPISSRLLKILKDLKEVSTTETVFGIKSCDSAWENARAAAGVADLHFHDLRATAITRMLRAGMRESEVMKISGHTQYSTFQKYVRQDATGAMESAARFDKYLEQQLAPSLPPTSDIQTENERTDTETSQSENTGNTDEN